MTRRAPRVRRSVSPSISATTTFRVVLMFRSSSDRTCLPLSSVLTHSIIGEAVLQMTRTEIMSSESGLCLDQIHRLSCHRYLSPSPPVDLPPLQQLPDCLLMQNFPSLLTSRVLNPAPKSCVLDCCAAPGNKWSHLCMLMQDQGLIVGVWARREAQVGMDRSRKKAIDNLFAIKKKFGYASLQVRYLDMTKAVRGGGREA